MITALLMNVSFISSDKRHYSDICSDQDETAATSRRISCQLCPRFPVVFTSSTLRTLTLHLRCFFHSVIHSLSLTHSSVTTQNKACPAGFLWDGLYGRWMDCDAEEGRWINWLQTTLGRLCWWIWKSCRLYEAVQWQEHILYLKSFTNISRRLRC